MRFSLKSQANVAVNQLNYRLDMFIVAALLPKQAGAQTGAQDTAARAAVVAWIVAEVTRSA